MDIGLLKVFQAVANEGSISKAAQKLGYVQSNVTARIQQLENELGVSLFHRHSRGMTVTSQGKILLEYTGKILLLCDEAVKAVSDSPIPSGRLTIGAMESTAAVRLPELMAKYHKRFPDVELNVVIAPTMKQIDAVLNYEVDGAFVDGPVEHSEIEQEWVFDEHLVLVANRDGGHPDLIEVQKKPLLLPFSDCIYRTRFEQWLYELGLPSMKVLEFGTIEGILGCVRSGFGASLLPKSIFDTFTDDKYQFVSFALPKQFGHIPTVFIRRRDVYSTSAMLKFIEMAKCKDDVSV